MYDQYHRKAQLMWRIVEDLEDEYPYYRFGWWGIIPLVIVN